MSTQFELLVTDGPLKGQRFALSSDGLRLGRSSSCEIAVSDPALSRNHCLFELRDGALWITDLASANGTAVNDVQLGTDSMKLSPGDQVTAGGTRVRVLVTSADSVAPPSPTPQPSPVPPAPGPKQTPVQEPKKVSAMPKIDLGFGKSESVQEAMEEKNPTAMRYVLWGVAALSVCAMFVLFLLPDSSAKLFGIDPNSPEGKSPAAENAEIGMNKLVSFSFEKVEADAKSIYRYELKYDGSNLSVQIDDVKGGSANKDRHLAKSMPVTGDMEGRLLKVLADANLYRLDPEYVGVPLEANSLQSLALHVVGDLCVFDVSVENQEPPEELRSAIEQLDTLVKNEFGIWAMQYSVEKLVEMSAESRRAGDAKWEERDVQYGNIAAALKKYTEAKVFLDTVEPKPADYASLEARRREVEAELEKRFSEQRFRADRAIKMEDWETAKRELRVLCEMIPDPKDKRHRDAASQLRDIEVRK